MIYCLWLLSSSVYTHHKTKCHDLEYTLHGEEDSEGCVEVFQDRVVGCRGRVVLKDKRRSLTMVLYNLTV